MNNYLCGVVCAAAFALFLTAASAQSATLQPLRLSPDDLKWAVTPAGAQRANPVGDDTKQGMYAYRLRYPANVKNQPHFHPDERIVTVLSGTLYVGFGETFDQSKMKALPAGSVWTEPAKQPHFVWAKDTEVIIQVIGNGPSGTFPVKSK